MADTPTLHTDRLILRPWRASDLEPFSALNADAEVMQHFPASMSAKETTHFVARTRAHFDEHGYGLWAVEVRDVAPFVGFIGLVHPAFEAPFTPAVEVGWRLARAHWNQGYATEGARRVVRFAFEEAGLDELVSFTVPDNAASRRLMTKLGMTHDAADDFNHPRLPHGHPLRKHVLYRLDADTWRAVQHGPRPSDHHAVAPNRKARAS
ncbi:MAG: GNAT family N-acetyltransferase [Myxococcota bacterium]